MIKLLIRIGAVALAAASLAACATPHYAIDHEGSRRAPPFDPDARGTMKPYQVNGVWYSPHDQPHYNETGTASWYGQQFHNRTTADGELFNMDMPSAAHKTLPLPSIVEVTNLDNGRRMRLRVNDRGPFVDGRIIDLSRAAADQLGFMRDGTAKVRVRYIGPAGPPDPVQRVAAAPPPAAYAANQYRAPRPSPWRPAPPAAPPITVSNQPILKPVWRVQAAAFTTREAAVAAAGRLDRAVVEPMTYNGAQLWRVMLGPVSDVSTAEGLRDEAAGAGYADARIVNPF